MMTLAKMPKSGFKPVCKLLEHFFNTSVSDSSPQVYLQLLREEWSIQTPVKQLREWLGRTEKEFQEIFFAFVHSSFAYEFHFLGVQSNERLEFLGDAVLDLYISERLCEKFPDSPEGVLSKMRGSLVNQDIFADFAKTLGLGDCLLLGQGEIKREGFERVSILCDAFEAFMGSLYLSEGREQVYAHLDRLFDSHTSDGHQEYFNLERLKDFDPKTQLQELTMKRWGVLPQYEVEPVENEFIVKLNINNEFYGEERSLSKKKAMKIVARKVLERIEEKRT